MMWTVQHHSAMEMCDTWQIAYIMHAQMRNTVQTFLLLFGYISLPPPSRMRMFTCYATA